MPPPCLRPAAQVTDVTGDAPPGETNDWILPLLAALLVIIVIAGVGIYLKKKKGLCKIQYEASARLKHPG